MGIDSTSPVFIVTVLLLIKYNHHVVRRVLYLKSLSDWRLVLRFVKHFLTVLGIYKATTNRLIRYKIIKLTLKLYLYKLKEKQIRGTGDKSDRKRDKL